MTATEEQAPPTVRRVADDELGLLITHLQGGGDSTPAATLDVALDLAVERAQARHQADVRAALAATARAMGDQARKAAAR